MKQIFRSIRSWEAYLGAVEGLSPQQKGELFELLTKYYLLLSPIYRSKLSDVWLLSEVPTKVRAELNLPDRDQGIDLIARTRTGGYWAVQCKYRSSSERSLTWREIATFTGLAFEVCKGIEFGLIAYTGERYAQVIKGASRIGLLSSDVWNVLDEAFFCELAATHKSEPVALHARTPRPHQTRAVANAVAYFAHANNTRGKLIMPCGTGKSLTAFWIAEALEARTIVVAVPSLSLIQQTLPEWLLEYAARGHDKSLRWLCVCSDQTVTKQDADAVVIHTQDLGFPCLTNPAEIAKWLEETEGAVRRVIFTTYQSGRVLADAVKAVGAVVDLAVMDEAHKTVGDKGKLFSHLLFDDHLAARRRMFMTATERRFAGEGDDVVSMDDPAIYGGTFEVLSFKEALDQTPPILSDYKIITMVIAHDDVAKLVSENRYVRPNGRAWTEEVEAQMLGSMVALRKAMQKYPIKHTVSFHSSIARADAFARFNDKYSEFNYDVGALETFHVTGAMPASVRKRVVTDFARAESSLITNARCLTEGVDVPNIDCVLFADAKQSTVDIVQAVGRALRPSRGKAYGYVIVPVISRGETAEELLESKAFAAVLAVLRSLAGNDERIIEYFRAQSSGRKAPGRIVSVEVDEKIGRMIDLEDFVSKIDTKVWSRLAALAWLTYDEASQFARSLHLPSRKAWQAYCRGELPDLPPRPRNVPSGPTKLYGAGFTNRGGWGAWLGTGRRATRGAQFRGYDEAAIWVRALKLKSRVEWSAYCNGGRPNLPPKPADIPRDPATVYREFHERGGMAAWLGKAAQRQWLPYDRATIFVHKLGLRSGAEWTSYCKGERHDLPPRPQNIPKTPETVFKSEFKEKGGWGGWLGTGTIQPGRIAYRSYDDAILFVHALQLTSSDEWQAYAQGKLSCAQPKPTDIPMSPRSVYGREFGEKGGMAGWLGTARGKCTWRSYDDAAKFVQNLKLKNTAQWKVYCKGERPDLPPKPHDIPAGVYKVYGKEFVNKGGMGGWLGTGQLATFNRAYLPYEKAVVFVRALKLKNIGEWQAYCKGERPDLPPKPHDIPTSAAVVYRDEFSGNGGWRSWLGNVQRQE